MTTSTLPPDLRLRMEFDTVYVWATIYSGLRTHSYCSSCGMDARAIDNRDLAVIKTHVEGNPLGQYRTYCMMHLLPFCKKYGIQPW